MRSRIPLLERWSMPPFLSAEPMMELGIFVAGALVGAIIQRYADRALQWVEGSVARRRLRSRSVELAEGFNGRDFSFCGIRASIFVAAFDPRGIHRSEITATLGPADPIDSSRAGEEAGALYSRAEGRWRRELEEGRIFNGTKLALRNFHPTRIGTHERSGLRLEFVQTDYLTQRIWTSVYQGLPDARREEIARQYGSEVDPLFSNTFGVYLAVITQDNDLVFVRRGRRTAVNAGSIVCGVVEGMDERDLRPEDGQPDPYMTAYRGLAEELGIRIPPENSRVVELTALTLNTDYYEWNMLGIADFRKARGEGVTSGYIRELWTTGKGRDKHEAGDLDFVQYEPQAVGAYVRQNLGHFVNYALVSTVYALLRDFPRHKVAAEFEQADPVYLGRQAASGRAPDP